MDPVRVSFLVCSNRGRGTLLKALEKISRQRPDHSWECLLVDNGFSDEESKRVLQLAQRLFADARFRMVKEPNPGLGHARRCGFQEASGDWIVMLDDDNYLEPNFIDELGQILENHTELGGICPLVYPIYGGGGREWKSVVAIRCLSVTEQALRNMNGLPRYFPSDQAASAPRPPGGGMIIRREVGLEWVQIAEATGTVFLGRTAQKPIGAEDEQIWRTLLSRRYPVLVTDRLRLAHDLPESRFGWRYLWRLNYWMAWSYAWLDGVEGKNLQTSTGCYRALHSLRHGRLILAARGKEERIVRWMDLASWLGREAGASAFRNGMKAADRA